MRIVLDELITHILMNVQGEENKQQILRKGVYGVKCEGERKRYANRKGDELQKL